MENSSPSPGPVRICTSCGSPVEAGHKFCEICGAKIEELPVCSKCGAQFIAPVKFCELCGTPALAVETYPDGEEESYGPEPEADEPEIYEQDSTGLEFQESDVPEPEPEPAIPEPEFIEPEADYEDPAPAPIISAAKKPKAIAEKIPLPGPEPEPAPVKKPAQFPVNKTLVIGGIVVLLLVIAGVYFVALPMLKGGTTPPVTAAPPTMEVTPPPVPADTVVPEVTVPTTVPTPTLDPHVPLPTDPMPANQVVYFDVQKDQVNKEITILFQRGPGENLISFADVRVTYPDGSVATGMLKPSQGNELVLKGSKGTDRVEVIAHMYSGKSYRVWDRLHT
jgi:hypothetical protein